VHRPELIETTAETERSFQVGYEIGDVARQLNPGGILVAADDLQVALRDTQLLLLSSPDAPLFEATFERDGVLVRADLLLPDAGGYRLVEVKSGTYVKNYYLEDASIQRWVIAKSVNLVSIEVAHVDTSFSYPGGGDYRGLLKYVCVDNETEALCQNVPDWIEGARRTLSGDEPVIEIGGHCTDPFQCPFLNNCNAGKPVIEFPLDGLPRLSAGKRQQLEVLGIVDVRQIPEDFPLTDAQARIRRVVIEGKPEKLPEAVKIFSALPYPRYYLDFETVRMAVPVWAGTRPYQKIPVQWSCHVERRPKQILQRSQQADGQGDLLSLAPCDLEHRSYLADDQSDPRGAFAFSLLEALGSEGPVIVYYKSFELGRIEELASDLPQFAPKLMAIASRVVDLLPIMRNNYYHPDMQGSWSIKNVLPTIASDLDYRTMGVTDGGVAEEAWLEILHPETSDERRQFLRKSLADYCALDTMAMVRLARFMQGPYKVGRKRGVPYLLTSDYLNSKDREGHK